MLIFKHELRAFLKEALLKRFTTHNCLFCPVAEFIRSKDDTWLGTVGPKRIRAFVRDQEGKLQLEQYDHSPWLELFISLIDSNNEEDGMISGAAAFLILEGIPE